MYTKVRKLSNNISYAFEKRRSNIGHIAVVVKAGTRYEPEGKEGLAHFMEHGIFKGTKKRKAYHILSSLDAIGGELNAYTTKEDLVLYASFLKPDFKKAVDVLSDMLFNSVFPEKELETEKDVVIDELKSYKDQPGEQIMDELEALFFGSHKLGRSILGKEKAVKSIQRDDLIEYLQSRLNSNSISIGVVGQFTENRVHDKLESFFGVHPLSTVSDDQERFNLPGDSVENIFTKPIKQSHIALAYPGPSAFEISRFEAHLVSNYLAGPALNSRLILELREKRGIAYHVESAYQSYDEAGMLSIYFGTEKDQIPIALKVIDRELEKLMNTPLGPRQLNLLKRQVKGHIAMADESGASVAISMARNLITYNKLESTQEIHQLIDAISVESLQASARRMFGDGKVLLEFLQK